MKKKLALLLAIIMVFGVFPLQGVAVNAVSVNNSQELLGALEKAASGTTVYLHGGTYELGDILNLRAANSGITLASYPGETANLTNSYAVTAWEECEVNGVKALCADANGKTVSALYKGENTLSVARLPEEGFYSLVYGDGNGKKGTSPDEAYLGFYQLDLKKKPTNMADVAVRVVHYWHSEYAAMTEFNEKTGLIRFAKYTGRPIEEGDRWCLENVIEGLDKAGEWCFDSAADKIYYIPQSGETADNLVLYASSSSKLIDVDGCENITFKDLRFVNCGWEYASHDYCNFDILNHNGWTSDCGQAMPDLPGAVTVQHSTDIVFEGCDFENLGCTALRFANGTFNCKVDSCYFNNIGGCGVFIGGQFFCRGGENDEKESCGNMTVTNCEIANYGTVFYSACGITLTYCDTAELSNNEIHDGYYTGISVGYMWLFGYNPTQYIKVKDNLIYNVGKYMLSDMGGIYLLGVQEGTEVTGNIVHDVRCYDGESGYAGDGIYLDSGCEFMTIADNLVFNCTTSAFNTTLSKNNVIKNNIFAFADQSVMNLGLRDYNIWTDLHSVYKNNIILTDEKVVCLEEMGDEGDHFCGEGNIMWDASYGDELYFTEASRSSTVYTRQQEENKGLLDSCVFADPGFTDANNYDFTFKDGAAALKNGFKEFSFDAGTKFGTTVGTCREGGMTAYNDYTNGGEKESANIGFGAWFVRTFYKVIDWFRNIFMKIFGITVTSYDSLYVTDVPVRSDNANTKQLEALYNEVKKHNPVFTVCEAKKPYADDDRIQAIYIDGETYQGKTTKVFAYIGFPENATADNPVPGMVVVHGGGGHAQAEWVQYWVNNGYACISVDGFGQEPIDGFYTDEIKQYNSTKWTVNPDSHPAFSEFADKDEPLNEQWFYFYLADIILANNILRNDTRVMKNEIGIAGISWGGYATSAVIGYDERFAFAVPIYGSAYSDLTVAGGGSSFFCANGVGDTWEPSLRLSHVKMPVLYLNGADDPFFSSDITTAAAANTENGSLTFIDGMGHGGYIFEEVLRFANAQTGRGQGNIEITSYSVQDGKATVSFTKPSDVGTVKVKVYYREEDLKYDFLTLVDGWQSKSGTVINGTATVKIPDNAKLYYISVEGKIGVSDTIYATTGVFER